MRLATGGALLLAATSACQEGDKDDTGEVVEAGPCGGYAIVDQAGASWEYVYDHDYVDEFGVDGGWTTTATGPGEHLGRAVWVTRAEGYDLIEEYEDFAWSTTTSYVCDEDGLWLSGVHHEYSYTLWKVDHEGWLTQDWLEMPLVLPASLELGTTWTYSGSYDYEDSDGMTFNREVDWTREVTQDFWVDVPAGAWEALLVEASTDAVRSEWVVEGVGTARIEGYAYLVDFGG